MGRNKELNKARRRTNSDRNRNGIQGNGKSREANRSATTTTAGDSTRGREEPAAARGPLKKLLLFFTAHPFLTITLAIGLPKALPCCMRWLRLRSGLMGPVMQVREEKQVLIVGSLGSGTLQMARALTALGVEVGHDTSDSSNERCRDGTASWAHGIRFLSGIPDLSRLCGAPRQQAYSSTMFQPSSECSYMFRSWDQCWADECRAVTSREYGCALRQMAKDSAAAAEAEAAAAAAGTQEGAPWPKGGVGGGERKGDAAPSTAAATTRSGAAPSPATSSSLSRESAAALARSGGEDGAGGPPKGDRGGRVEERSAEGTASVPGQWQEGERAWEEGGEEEEQECGTPFRRSLLQVRHPLRTVTLLAYRSARNKKGGSVRDNDCSAGRQQLTVASSLFTNKFVRTQLGRAGSRGSDAFLNFDWATVATSCVQTWAWYWVVYNRAMLSGGGLDVSYRVEDTSPQKVAALAGFSNMGVNEVLEPTEGQAASDRGALEGSSAKSIGGFEVTWEDIAAFPGGLLEEMSDLAVELGYEPAPARLLPERERVSHVGKDGADLEKGDGETKKGWRRMFSWRRKSKA